MPRITFIHPALSEPKTLDATPGGGADRRGAPRRGCRCTGAGWSAPAAPARCASPTPQQPRDTPWPRKERNVQTRHGLIDAATQARDTIDDSPERWRWRSLIVGEEDWEGCAGDAMRRIRLGPRPSPVFFHSRSKINTNRYGILCRMTKSVVRRLALALAASDAKLTASFARNHALF